MDQQTEEIMLFLEFSKKEEFETLIRDLVWNNKTYNSYAELVI